MCVVVTKITETRTCCAAAGDSFPTRRSSDLAARNFAERICMCRAAVTGHEVSSNCSRYKKRSKTTGTNLLYTTNIQKGGVLL